MACTPELLKTVPLFALLDEQEAAVLAREVEVKTFAARQRIYKMGDPSGQAYVMVSGSVRITTVDEDQQEVIVDQPAHGFYFRLSYTYARATDDGQDALVAGRPVTVQNTYSTSAERGPSVTDQRNRVAFSCIAEPRPFGRDHTVLGKILNDWKLAGVVTYGSGRPFDARVFGDPNQDSNTGNDRLPGYGRNAFTGPDYATTDLRITRRVFVTSRLKMDLIAESFNLFNRDNQRVIITDDGFQSNGTQFTQLDKTIGISTFPAYYQHSTNFLTATSAYAPRQVQLALRMTF